MLCSMKRELYSIWGSMIQRCTNPKRDSWNLYGARGIKVCDRWRIFANFAEDMAPRPLGTTLDRVDPNGNYEKSNCRWATPKEQAFTKRKKLVEYCINCNGSTLTASGGYRSWKGLCHACNEYKRRNGIDRPLTEEGLNEQRKMRNALKPRRQIVGISLETGKKIIFPSRIEAEKKYGGGVSNCLYGISKTAKGFTWHYQEKTTI